MNARILTLTLACVAVLVVACAPEQQEAFMRSVGGVDGLMKNIKDATGTVDEPREVELGHGITETLLGARPLLDDPALQRYVNEVGRWVAQQSERPLLPWRFGVNDSEHVNAFAAPGGYVIVTRGMLRVVRNEAELAGVLGHEVAHVVRKHHLNALRKGAWVNLLGAGAAAGTAGEQGGELVEALVGPTKELYARGLDKDDEFEADRIGVVLATRAGYDPWGLPAALQTLGTLKTDDPYLALLFKTHPNPGARLDELGVAMAANFDGFQGLPTNADRYLAATKKMRSTPPQAESKK
ncbi:MAG: M48 family metalloprotease [Burkholderiales bacterium]|nr:M48 family metalloprotease [Burkholderiales bacterium]